MLVFLVVDVYTPRTLDEALRLKAEHPDARFLQGGTDVLVELNFGRSRPDALVNLEETGASEADLRERVQGARNALELSQIRYESGYSPYLEVLDAQRTANDAELAFVRNRQARLVFSVDLMRALGGGWQ